METAGLNQVLDFSDILINGELVGDKVHSVTFRDELLDYMDDASAEDSRKSDCKKTELTLSTLVILQKKEVLLLLI